MSAQNPKLLAAALLLFSYSLTSSGLLCVVYQELEESGGWFLAKMYD